MADNTLFTIPEGVESITVTINAYGKDYDLPAVRDVGDTGDFRIPHKALSRLFRILKQEKKGLRMETGVIDGTFVGELSPAYACAACRITADGNPGDVYYGEVNVNFSSPKAEREAPFCCAVSRAQDKAILALLGVESQWFDENGNPSLYHGCADVPVNTEEEAKNEDTVAKNAEDTDDAIDSSATFDVKPLITPDEEAEFQILAKTNVKVGINGVPQTIPLGDVPDESLQKLATLEKPLPIKDLAVRYIELRAKRSEAAPITGGAND